MYGANTFSSTLMRRWLSASQFASSPSPSEVARPMPVIQTSAASLMRHCLLRKADPVGHRVHVHTQIGMRERDMAEGQIGAALQLGADAYLRRSDRKSRTLILDLGIDRQ